MVAGGGAVGVGERVWAAVGCIRRRRASSWICSSGEGWWRGVGLVSDFLSVWWNLSTFPQVVGWGLGVEFDLDDVQAAQFLLRVGCVRLFPPAKRVVKTMPLFGEGGCPESHVCHMIAEFSEDDGAG